MKHFKFFEPLTMEDVDPARIADRLLTAMTALDTLKEDGVITEAEYREMTDKVQADARKWLGLPELPSDKVFKTINNQRVEAGLPPVPGGGGQKGRVLMAWCTHNDKAIWISFDIQDGSLRRVKLCPICGEVSSAEATVATTATETLMVTRQLLRDMECVCEMYHMLAEEVPGVAQAFLRPGQLFDRTEKEIQLLLSGRKERG